jgi:hypothetical protein
MAILTNFDVALYQICLDRNIQIHLIKLYHNIKHNSLHLSTYQYLNFNRRQHCNWMFRVGCGLAYRRQIFWLYFCCLLFYILKLEWTWFKHVYYWHLDRNIQIHLIKLYHNIKHNILHLSTYQLLNFNRRQNFNFNLLLCKIQYNQK